MRFAQNRIIALFFPALLITVIVFGNSGTVNASTNVPGVISSDAVWTKAGSPYELLGSVLVNKGAVLTIEPGVVVNLNGNELYVNGTLVAKGTESDLILFNGGNVQFSYYSIKWDEQTGSGCILEYADLSDTTLGTTGVTKISKCSIWAVYVSGPAIVSGNTIFHRLRVSGPAIVEYNSIVNIEPESVWVTGGSPTISYNDINCRIRIDGGSPTISYNTIADGIHFYPSDIGEPKIIGNTINVAGNHEVVYILGSNVSLIGNTITGRQDQIGIRFLTSNSFVVDGNTISNCELAIQARFDGHLTIEKNTITDNQNGIHIDHVLRAYMPVQNWSVIIRNNEISNNQEIGVYVRHSFTTITNNSITNNNVGIEVSKAELITLNNIHDNQYNLEASVIGTIDVPNNYWGTTNPQEIDQTIYDKKYDYHKGTANFTPFLTEPNPEIPEFPTHVVLPLMLSTAIVAFLYKKRINKLKI